MSQRKVWKSEEEMLKGRSVAGRKKREENETAKDLLERDEKGMLKEEVELETKMRRDWKRERYGRLRKGCLKGGVYMEGRKRREENGTGKRTEGRDKEGMLRDEVQLEREDERRMKQGQEWKSEEHKKRNTDRWKVGGKKIERRSK